MKKTPRWRQMRLQKKREKARLHKQVKADRDVTYHGPFAGDISFERVFGRLNTPVTEQGFLAALLNKQTANRISISAAKTARRTYNRSKRPVRSR